MAIIESEKSSTIRYIVIHSILTIVLSLGVFTGYSLYELIAVILIIIIMIVQPIQQDLYLIVMLAPFENLVAINGRRVFFAVLLIYSLKFFFHKHTFQQKEMGCLLCTIALISLEILNEFSVPNVVVSPYALLNTIFYLLFFFIIMCNFSWKEINIKQMIITFNLSILITIIVTFSSYGGISEFIVNAKQANYIYRMGNTTASTLGGAMGISLYSSLALSTNVVLLTLKNNQKSTMKILSLITIILSVVIGVLSISRAFYLCLSVFIIFYIVINLIQKEKYLIASIISIFAVVTIVVFLNSSDFSWIVQNISSRISEEEGAGLRGEIWKSCVSYLINHPFRLLFGLGSNCYDQYGAATNQLFSYTAHNFILDILMSFGIIGFIMLCCIFVQFVKKLSYQFGEIDSWFSCLPFVMFMTFGLTALRTATGKTWIYLIMTTIYMYMIRRETHDYHS